MAAKGHNAASNGTPNIIDIRSDAAGISVRKEISKGLRPSDGGEKTLPTLLLYDQEGLKLFEEITYLDEYYLTGQEIEVLEKYSARIAERIPDHALLVELGSGNLRKVKLLLDALDATGKDISYFALDLSEVELERTLAAVPEGTFKHVKCFGLLGTYDDGLEWMKRPENAPRPKTILSMGSSIGNFPRDEAVGFVKQFADVLEPRDSLIFGVDACQDPDTVYKAYNDSKGTTHRFTLNGLKHANEIMGEEAFKLDDWEAAGKYDEKGGKHQAFVVPRRDVTIDGVALKQGEMIRIEESYKYNTEQSDSLWREAGVVDGQKWANRTGDYALHMLNKPDVMFPTRPEEYAGHPVPSLAEWQAIWRAWDCVTRHMIPEEELGSKPIKLRNACIFYLGHIPTFLDMKITEGTGGKPTEPSHYYNIFERGIDPDVDNPEDCHAHSEIPDSWPPLEEMLGFQDRVRERVTSFYTTGQAYSEPWTGRVLWLGLEHEAMHLETLLYMLVQSEKTLPPVGTTKPDFEELAKQARLATTENEWFDIPQQSFQEGIDDPDTADDQLRHFGWDCEKPPRTFEVPAFKAKGRPITNGEYAEYLRATKNEQLPASWYEPKAANGVNGEVNGVNGTSELEDYLHGKAVRTVYGPVPLKYTLEWPVSASYDELSGCAQYFGGRIPTLEETRSIYFYTDSIKKKEVAKALGKTIPAVNGHLVNDGVQESPPSPPPSVTGSKVASTPDPNTLFANLDSANVGFKHWHPMPVSSAGNKLAGQGEMGGLWEWTSTPLTQRPGFEPMKLYPAYSADFYDGKHNVVLGGSWATHPRIAGRKTFINWYQRNYPYVWAGARMVKDV